MLVESIIKRKHGSNVRVWGTHYHFAPDDQGRHVAEVADPAHVEKLLSTGSFRLIEDAKPGTPEPQAAAADTEQAEQPKPKRRGRPPKGE